MKITRSKPQQDFVIIPNAALEDRRLSWKAAGLLAHLLSRPDGWSIDAERLARSATDDRGSGRSAVLRGLRELEHAGYLVRTRVQGADGRWRTEQAVYDFPQPAPGADPNQLAFESSQVAPRAGKPTSVNPTFGPPNVGPPDVGLPNVGSAAAKRQDGEQDGGGARAPRGRPATPPDATHGGRHPEGNPGDVGCRRCGEEKAAASAAAIEAAKRRERDAQAAARAARAAELAAGTTAPPASRLREIAAAERAAVAAQRSVLLSEPSGAGAPR